MKLYIGGLCQGQEALARRENPGAALLTGFHAVIREKLAAGEDTLAYAQRLCAEQPELVVVSDVVGSGVVPISKEERLWREAVGRALCVVAEHAESVTRVMCGIGVRLK